jgi:hypothetical protein
VSFLAAFREPFVGASFERARVNIVLRAASSVPVDAACGSVLAALPGGVPWTREGLQFRAACLRLLGDARTDQADDDVRTFADGEQAQLILGPPSQP